MVIGLRDKFSVYIGYNILETKMKCSHTSGVDDEIIDYTEVYVLICDG